MHSRADHGTPGRRSDVTRNSLVFTSPGRHHDLDDLSTRKEVPPMINTSCVTATIAGGADLGAGGMRFPDVA
jgi:hypothetical protein